MIIAIPSVTEYIQTSRKNSFIVTAQSFIVGYVFDWDSYKWIKRENIANNETFNVDCRNSVFSISEDTETFFIGNLGYGCVA